MDGERRKRKMENDEEEADDEKMQKFFALIRSTRDVRERIMSGADKLQEEAKKKGEEEKAVEVWNPSFKPEDFMEGADHSKGPQASLTGPSASPAGPSKREDKTKEEEEEDKGGGGGDGLDLNLSL